MSRWRYKGTINDMYNILVELVTIAEQYLELKKRELSGEFERESNHTREATQCANCRSTATERSDDEHGS